MTGSRGDVSVGVASKAAAFTAGGAVSGVAVGGVATGTGAVPPGRRGVNGQTMPRRRTADSCGIPWAAGYVNPGSGKQLTDYWLTHEQWAPSSGGFRKSETFVRPALIDNKLIIYQQTPAPIRWTGWTPSEPKEVHIRTGKIIYGCNRQRNASPNPRPYRLMT